MPLLQFVCPRCGQKSEELVKNTDSDFFCKNCGEKLVRDYTGKVYGSMGKAGGGCTSDCKNCSGCK